MYRSYLGVVCVTVVGRFLVSFACRVSGDARVASRNVTCLLTWTNRIAVMRAQARLSTWRQLFPSQVQIFAMCAISTFHQSFRISTGSTILTIKFGGFFKIYFFFQGYTLRGIWCREIREYRRQTVYVLPQDYV